MKLTTLSLVLSAFLALVGPLHALSLLSEVRPSHPEVAGFTVDIKHEHLADGTIKFRVVVTEKEAKFSSKPSATLGTVKVADHASSVTGSQVLPTQRQEHSIVCLFTATEASLGDPDFCFVFTNGVERVINGKLVPMPSADFVYARLKDFIR